MDIYTLLVVNRYADAGDIYRMPYANSEAPDLSAHLRSMTRELHCPLISFDTLFYGVADGVALRSDYAAARADLGLHCPYMVYYPADKELR